MLPIDFAPWRLTGTVYGALLNHAPELAALGDAAQQPPYKAPPRAPVLQVKPRNTLVGEGARVAVPADAAEGLELGATLAIVIGRTACRVRAEDALSHVAGFTVACDIRVPHASHYRPAVRHRARDGFCPIAAQGAPLSSLPVPDASHVQVAVNGVVVHDTDTNDRIRSVAALLADVSEFMTLQPGDVLLLGASAGSPRAHAGQQVSITIAGVGTLGFTLVAESGAAS
jgi:5-oxopent-3-ene-1,2,5-tricarboxylate decarboxylase / 2-hydroxyhepta-2,4-diene-1,7-dioate isomerase